MEPVTRKKRTRGSFTVSKKHKRVKHWHGGLLVAAKPLWMVIPKSPGGTWIDGAKWLQAGLLCPVCGFHPNETAKDMTRQAIEAIGRKEAASRTK